MFVVIDGWLLMVLGCLWKNLSLMQALVHSIQNTPLGYLLRPI